MLRKYWFLIPAFPLAILKIRNNHGWHSMRALTNVSSAYMYKNLGPVVFPFPMCLVINIADMGEGSTKWQSLHVVSSYVTDLASHCVLCIWKTCHDCGRILFVTWATSPLRMTAAKFPVCTQRTMKLLCGIIGWSCPCITIWKLVPTPTAWHIMPHMNLAHPQEICIFLAQMEEEVLPKPRPNPLV